jgi:segregation and condensation protein B
MENETNHELMKKVDQLTMNNILIDEIEKEESWKDRTGLDFDGLCGAIETIIFMSDKPVPLMRLKKVIDDEIPLKIIHESIQKLQGDYEKKHHGIRLVEIAEGYQFRTKAVFSRFVQDLFKITGLTLTPSCLEVLAIIAYRQPVSKFDVEKIRGVDSSHLIRTLMDKRLVKLLGRSDDMGRPSIYGTTSEFLDVFNLSDLGALPPEYELESIIESKKVDINQISHVRNASQENFVFDDVDELEDLASKIRSISTTTSFTSELSSNKKGDNTTRKNAFELLESHIDKNLINQFMLSASESDTLGIPDEVKVLQDLLGDFANAPVEEEEFEMIDLDTGEAITNVADFSLDGLDAENLESPDSLDSKGIEAEMDDEIVSQDLNSSSENAEGVILDAQSLFDNDDSSELSELESALDAAFDKFKNAQKSNVSDEFTEDILDESSGQIPDIPMKDPVNDDGDDAL